MSEYIDKSREANHARRRDNLCIAGSMVVGIVGFVEVLAADSVIIKGVAAVASLAASAQGIPPSVRSLFSEGHWETVESAEFRQTINESQIPV